MKYEDSVTQWQKKMNIEGDSMIEIKDGSEIPGILIGSLDTNRNSAKLSDDPY